MPHVQLPSVPEILRGFLAGRLAPTPVHVNVPRTRPAEFVRAWRTGGGAINRVLDEPIITVQGWAASDARAEELAARCRDALLNDYTGMPLVRGVEIISGPYRDPDPDSETPRYTVTARLRVRGKRP